MYKIRRDDDRESRFRLQYFLSVSSLDPLYTIENLTWEDVERFVISVTNEEELNWMYDLIRLSDKIVLLDDFGSWNVL